MRLTTRTCLAGVAASALLVGCGPDEGTSAATGPDAGVASTEVTVTVVAGETSTVTLTCDPPGGDHPDPEAACTSLVDAMSADPNPLDPVPPEQLCTEIYGGDQTAVVEGTVTGEPVRAELSRVNGCEIARWDALVPLLVEPGGVDD